MANVYVCRGADLVDASFFSATREEAPGDARGADARPAPDPAAPAGARSSGEPAREDASPTVRKSNPTAYIDRALLWTEATTSAMRGYFQQRYETRHGRLAVEEVFVQVP